MWQGEGVVITNITGRVYGVRGWQGRAQGGHMAGGGSGVYKQEGEGGVGRA